MMKNRGLVQFALSVACVVGLFGGVTLKGWGQEVTVELDGTEVSGKNLAQCLEGSQPVKSMKVTKGTFTHADWKTMKERRNNLLKGLEEVVFAKEVKVTEKPFEFRSYDSQEPSYYFSTTIKHVHFQGEEPSALNQYVFAKCSALESVTLPQGVTILEERTFSGCSALKAVIIPQGVTKIKEKAFADCTALKELTIPDGVTEIDKYTFEGCTALEKVTLPKELIKIGNRAFSGCTALKELTIPTGVTEIEGLAFENCTALEKINLSKRLTIIDKQTFTNCSKLQTINLPEGLTKIDNNAFQDCSLLQEIIIPDAVTYIGTNAFMGCVALQEIVIPDAVTEVGCNAFRDCAALQKLVISEGLKYIEGGTFEGCKALQEITCKAEIPPYLQEVVNGEDKKVFEGVDVANCTLYVPEQSVQTYQETAVWEEFKIMPLKRGVTFRFTEADGSPKPVFQLVKNGKLESVPTNPTRKGYRFKEWNTKKDGKGITFDASKPIQTSMTMFAVWEVDVTFDANEGTFTGDKKVPVIEGTTVATDAMPTELKKEGRVFKEWNTKKDGSGDTFDAETPVEHNITVFAIWVEEFTVTFDANEGTLTGDKSVSVPDGHKITADAMPKKPTRDGYVFKGWNTKADGSGNSFNNRTPVTQNMTVYAIWEKDKASKEDPEKPSAVESTLLANVTIGPNPCNQYIVVHGVEEANAYRIINMVGRTLLSGTLHDSPTLKIDTHSLPAGVYILSLQATDGVTTFKLIKR